MTETTYAVLYLRPDGYWVAGEGWTDPRQAEEDAKEQIPDKPWSSKEEPTTKVVKVGSDEYKQAKALEEENTPFFLKDRRHWLHGLPWAAG